MKMKTIYKYTLALDELQVVPMPRGATIIDCQKHQDDICLWAIIDTNEPHIFRRIVILGTGHLIPDNNLQYIATVQDRDLIWHVFEQPEPLTDT